MPKRWSLTKKESDKHEEETVEGWLTNRKRWGGRGRRRSAGCCIYRLAVSMVELEAIVDQLARLIGRICSSVEADCKWSEIVLDWCGIGWNCWWIPSTSSLWFVALSICIGNSMGLGLDLVKIERVYWLLYWFELDLLEFEWNKPFIWPTLDEIVNFIVQFIDFDWNLVKFEWSRPLIWPKLDGIGH